MKKAIIIILLIAIAFAVEAPKKKLVANKKLVAKPKHKLEAQGPKNYCTAAQQKGVCTEDWKPVLGQVSKGHFQMYGNACKACHVKDVAAAFYYDLGACEDVEVTKNCPKTGENVCALHDTEFKQYSNACLACKDKKNKYFYRDTCPPTTAPA